MNLVSFDFLLLLGVTLLIYYSIAIKKQYIILLISSLIFYLLVCQGSKVQMLLILVYVILTAYIGTMLLVKCNGKMRTFCIIITDAMLIIALVMLKYVYNVGLMFIQLLNGDVNIDFLHFIAPVGLSYFVLSTIGYTLDVYWNAYKPEKNLCKLSLFICYFPQLISGPLTRYADMNKQFSTTHNLEYCNIEYGLRRMAWGYFLKLVIADRLGQIVHITFSDYDSRPGILLIIATLCYALQLYTDFSGCMHIIIGTSQLFGIVLPENFCAPFFAQNIPEFWRRWHISLGTWFKDYLMYPLLKSNVFQRIGAESKLIFGKKKGKKIPTFIALAIMWFLIGLWHGGTLYYFFASAFIPCIFLMGSEILTPYFKKITEILKININCFSFRTFQRFRTILLMCICWVFVCTQSTKSGLKSLLHMFTQFRLFDLAKYTLDTFDFKINDVFILIIGLIVLVVADYLQNNNSSITEFVDKQNILFKYIIIWFEVIAIMCYAVIGKSTFIYFQF